MDIENWINIDHSNNAEEMMLDKTQLLGLTGPEMTVSCWWDESIRY